MAAIRNLRQRARTLLRLDDIPPRVRRVIVGVIGTTVVLFGIALMVLPGPAIVVIPLGLAILATEFVWARRWLQRARTFMYRIKNGNKAGQKGAD